MKAFQTDMAVRVTDLNYGGHLGNVALYSYFHEARSRYLLHLGLNEGDIGDGVSLTQTEGHIEYKAEAFLGDVLTIDVHFDEFRRVRFRTNYKVVRKSDGTLIGEGYVKLAAFSYETKRPQKLPQSFIDKVNRFQHI